jgi:hypothetical protein
MSLGRVPPSSWAEPVDGRQNFPVQARLVPQHRGALTVLPSDLTALVFSNLLWFLLTLCLGSVLVTRPYRAEHAGQGGRGTAPYPVADEGRPADDEFADQRLAPLPPVEWSDATLPPRRSSVWPRPLTRPVRRASGPARHRRPRPAYETALTQAAAVAIAVVMAGAGIGLGLHLTSDGHTSAVPPGGLAADTFAMTAPPVITRPHITRRPRAADSRPDRLQAARAQLAATLIMIRFLGHDLGAGHDGRSLLPSLTRKAARLRAEIVRMEHRRRGAGRQRGRSGSRRSRNLLQLAVARPLIAPRSRRLRSGKRPAARQRWPTPRRSSVSPTCGAGRVRTGSTARDWS